MDGVETGLFNRNRACVTLGSRVDKYFYVRRGLRQGCLMSPWVFDIVVRQVIERAIGREGGE